MSAISVAKQIADTVRSYTNYYNFFEKVCLR